MDAHRRLSPVPVRVTVVHRRLPINRLFEELSSKTLLAGGLFLLQAFPCQAQLADPGYSGLISTPTPEVMRQGRLALAFSWVNGSETYLFSPNTNRIVVLTAGLLPNLETTLRFTQVIGWQDPESPGVAFGYAVDRMMNLKYQIPLPLYFPKISFGMQDIGSVNELSGYKMKPGASQYGQSMVYAVIGRHQPPFAWHFGFASSAAFLSGYFGGVSFEPLPGWSIFAEYDSHSLNYAVRWLINDIIWVRAARRGGSTWSLSSGFELAL